MNNVVSRPATLAEARQVFKRYIALLYRLTAVEKNHIDIIVGAGDSGAGMVGFAREFFAILGKRPPKTLLLPIQRFAKTGRSKGRHYDNSVLLPSLRKELRGLQSVKNIFFLDDEIWQAWTAHECMQLMVKALPKRLREQRILYTIIAEHHAFEWHYDLPPVAIRYYAFSKKIRGVNNSIFEILPKRFVHQYHDVRIVNKKQVANILLNGLLKSFDGVPHYQQLKGSFADQHYARGLVRKLIREAIREYRSGKLQFLF